MAKPEWGAKRTCHNCGARFYDLCREPIVCPVCSTVYDLERQPRVRRGGAVVKEDAPSRPKISKAAVADDLAEDEVDDARRRRRDDDNEDEADDNGDGDKSAMISNTTKVRI